jgi:membrane protein YdbS with pleckstrin-like domain
MPFEDLDRYDDFNIWGGCCFLSCIAGPYTLLASPCMYLRMTTQEVRFEGNRLHFSYDCLFTKEDKLIPLDRIQDANIEANCCARCCGISVLNIQTANGSPAPEAIIVAPRDANALRSMIMDRRDQLVHNNGGIVSTGIDGVMKTSPVHGGTMAESTVELKGIRGTLDRIELLMAKGVEKFERMDVR